MPLLEIGDDKPLLNRFSFLNLSQEEHRQSPSPTKQIVEDVPKSQSLVTRLSEQPSEAVLGHEINVKDMQPVGVIKTTTSASKLFINLTTPARSLNSEVVKNNHFFISAVSCDTDKAGVSCSVITVLDVRSRINLDLSSDVLSLLDHLRKFANLSIGDEYTLPRMRKKGPLSKVSAAATQTFKAKATQQNVASVAKITELETVADDRSASIVGTLAGTVKHTTTKLTVASLALPLPTRYSHHFSISLPSSDRRASWSVYFDGQDSSLKILLPPQEEFITLQAAIDDFRAFTKDSRLHVFFVGAA